MNEKIKKRLDEYLEFDSGQIFRHCDLVRIFGGAIRDILADMEIHDIDILCGSKSYPMLKTCLEYNGYHHLPQLTPVDLQSIYSDINVINAPETYVKNKKVVQIILPATGSRKNFAPEHYDSQHRVIEKYYISGFKNLISNVDISCCGVSWDGKTLFENFPGAVSHCISRCFHTNEKSLMFSTKRIQQRVYKMLERGWTIFKPEDTQMSRDLKIENLFSEKHNEISYITEYIGMVTPKPITVQSDDYKIEFEF
jgi:hypothetical protein